MPGCELSARCSQSRESQIGKHLRRIASARPFRDFQRSLSRPSKSSCEVGQDENQQNCVEHRSAKGYEENQRNQKSGGRSAEGHAS